MSDLADRCEAATPDKQRDLLIEAHLQVRGMARYARPEFLALVKNDGFIDAAMTLIPKGWRFAGSETIRGDFYAHLITREGDPKRHSEGNANALSMAIAAAALRCI